MNLSQQVANKLLQINAIKLSPQKPFVWASGLHSPIYCDNRTVLSYPQTRRFIIDAFVERSRQFEPFDLVAGVATAGIAHGALLAERLELPFVYVRSKPKGHGRQNQIEGVLPAGRKVLVIEDLISTGGSCLRAVEALREAGATVAGVLAIFSYGFELAADAFARADCPYDTLSDYETLLQEAIAKSYISEKDKEVLQKWRQSPEKWSAAF